MRQYIILLDGDSKSGCGNDWTISTEYRQYAKIMEVVGNMMRWNKDARSAYIITECQYTQKLCEMDINNFGEYVKKVGKRMI